MPQEKITLQKFIDFSVYLQEGERLIHVTINADDQINALILSSDQPYRTEDGTSSLIKSEKPKSFRFLVFDLDGQLIQETRIENEFFNFHFGLFMNSEEILLASARCAYHDNDPDKNARVFDLKGNFLRDFVLGDGIESVKVDRSGKIWTSYFDEGIFGNYGWNQPVGAPGLICWDKNGKKEWEFEPREGLDYICDCYAFNFDSQGNIWFYYYTDFSLVKMDVDKNLTIWKCPTRGAHALNLDQNFVLMAPGYDQDYFTLYQAIPGQSLISTKEIIFQSPNGGSIKMASTLSCFGDNLAFLEEDVFYYMKFYEIY